MNCIHADPSRYAPRSFTLSWSHYVLLLGIKNPDERSFYEIEAAALDWNVRELKRQYDSSLYERLALSRDNAIDIVVGDPSPARPHIAIRRPDHQDRSLRRGSAKTGENVPAAFDLVTRLYVDTLRGAVSPLVPPG